MQWLKQYAVWLGFCEQREKTNSMGCSLSINNNYDQITINNIDPTLAITLLNPSQKDGTMIKFPFFGSFKFQPRLKFIQNFSTMHPTRIARLVSLASTRFLANRLLHKTSVGLWALPRAGFGLSTHNKFQFTSQRESLVQEEEAPSKAKQFSEFISDKEILRNLKENGITQMFPIQEVTFRLIQKGKDILASDRTGSGKTLAYTLPVLQKFNRAKYNQSAIKTPKFLILCPTRELVMQVTNELNKFTSTYKVVALYGGTSIQKQMAEINRGVAIIVATPGRLIDLLERRAIVLNQLEVVCIDEADTMLEKGFKDDVEEIFGYVRKAAGKTQNIMFSATIPIWVNQMAKQYFSDNMERINMIKDQAIRTSETVEHLAQYVRRDQRHSTIRSLIQQYNPNSRTIIFTKTKLEANEFVKEFDSNKIVILHGDIPQSNREYNMREFRQGVKKVLIATDVAARGIDIPDVDLVIQLSPPENPEPYIHRSGRTGRAGKQGANVTFFDETNVLNLIEIEKAAKIKIKILNNNYSTSYWQTKLKKTIDKINHFKPGPDVAVYQHCIKQLLAKTSPQNAILFLLKEQIGPQPEATSTLTNKKGFITYLATPIEGSSSTLSKTFKSVVIHNQTTDNDGIKFDIHMSDSLKFEEIVGQQQQFKVELFNENSNTNLQSFAKKMGSAIKFYQRKDQNYNSDRENEWNDRRDRSNSHQREQRNERGHRQQKEMPKEFNQINIPEGLPVYNVFLYGYPPEVKEIDMKDQIVNQTNLTGFKLRLRSKVDDLGNTKKFGFATFTSREDCIKFLESTVEVDGSVIKKKFTENR